MMRDISTWMLVVTAVWSVVSVIQPSEGSTLSHHPVQHCAGCRVICEVLGTKMNESAKVKQTVLTGHRLEGERRKRRVDYESSELRAVELMDDLCKDKDYADYKLVEDPSTGLRIFAKNASAEVADYYANVERRNLNEPKKRLTELCSEILDEHDEFIVGLIRRERDLDAIQEKLCSQAAQLCVGPKYDKAVSHEIGQRTVAMKKKKAREEKAEKEKKEREAKEAEKFSQYQGSNNGTNSTTDAAKPNDAPAADDASTPPLNNQHQDGSPANGDL